MFFLLEKSVFICKCVSQKKKIEGYLIPGKCFPLINGLRGTAEAEAEAEAAVSMVTSQAIASQNEAMNYLKQCDQMVNQTGVTGCF